MSNGVLDSIVILVGGHWFLRSAARSSLRLRKPESKQYRNRPLCISVVAVLLRTFSETPGDLDSVAASAEQRDVAACKLHHGGFECRCAIVDAIHLLAQTLSIEALALQRLSDAQPNPEVAAIGRRICATSTSSAHPVSLF
jgi:hypothetical protein